MRDIPFMVKDRIDWSRGLNKTLFWLVQYWLCTWTKTECHTFASFPCNLCLELLSSFCLWWGRCKDCCCCRNIFFHVTRRQKVASEDRDQIVFKTRRSLFFGCTQYWFETQWYVKDVGPSPKQMTHVLRRSQRKRSTPHIWRHQCTFCRSHSGSRYMRSKSENEYMELIMGATWKRMWK